MAPYVPIPAGFHDVVHRQIMRYGTDLAAANHAEQAEQ